MNRLGVRGLVLVCGFLFFWQAVIWLFKLPPYFLPSPYAVMASFYHEKVLLFHGMAVTALETFLGLFLGVVLGAVLALLMTVSRFIRFWFIPVLLISQALPTIVIAPLLVIWFGYGLSSKVIATVLMIFFPVAFSFFDGLKATPQGWLDLAKTMQAKPWRVFLYLRIPAALPRFASGVRVATAIAPVGVVVGEWVGSSRGLGFLILNANARMQIDLMFAATLLLVVFSLCLYQGMNSILNRWIDWDRGE